MNAAELVAAASALVEAVKEFPELAHAAADLFETLRTHDDPTPALKHLEAVAVARELEISTEGL